MADKIIAIENRKGPSRMLLQRILRMVPDKDRDDKHLQRLLAFRLEIDGEARTTEYLIQKIREVIQCAYTGRLYDYLKNDRLARTCIPSPQNIEPPEIA